MATIRISEAEATGDFPALLARVRSGTEVVIDKVASPSVVLRVADVQNVRRLSESLSMARKHQSTATLDDDFPCDLENVIKSHPEPLESLWD